MQTSRAILKNNQIHFVDAAPFPLEDEREHPILVTFLDEEVGSALEPAHQPTRIYTAANLHYRLSETEVQLLRLAKQGLTNEQIGQKLGYRRGTVTNYLSAIYQRFRVTNRMAAIAKAVELKFLE